MRAALDILGYRTYHYTEASQAEAGGRNDLTLWIEGLNAKIYGKGKPFGKVEFDKLLGEYSAVTDTPCVNFYKELITAYPDVKVILTTRDPDEWIQSMERSVLEILSWRIWGVLNRVKYLGRPGLKAAHDTLELALTDWTSGNPYDRDALRRGFIAHNNNVRSAAPDLLEFSPKDGWEPLCRYLGKDVPEKPFPYVNKGGNAARLMGIGLTISIVKQLTKFFSVPILAWMAYRWRDHRIMKRMLGYLPIRI